MFSISRLLLSARKARRIELCQAAERTKISGYYLRAIEEGRFQSIPRGFDIGYIRIYAEFLGLEPDMIVKRYREESGSLDPARNADRTTEPDQTDG